MKKKSLIILFATLAAFQLTGCSFDTSDFFNKAGSSVHQETSAAVIEPTTANTESSSATIENQINSNTESVNPEPIRETNGNAEEYKEGDSIKIENIDTLKEEAKTIPVADTSGYQISLDDKFLTIPVPTNWVADSTNLLLQCDLPEYDEKVSVDYSDSYVEVGDTAELKEILESKESVSGIKGQLGKTSFDKKHDSYVIIIENQDWNEICVYQEIPGYNTYLEIKIVDFTKKVDTNTLISKCVLNIDGDVTVEEVKPESKPAETTSEVETVKEVITKPTTTGYPLQIDGSTFMINVPDSWVQSATEHIIQCTNSEYGTKVYVNYSDSYIDIDDTDALQKELESIEKAANKKGQLGKVHFDNQEDGYVILMEQDDWNSINVYQKVPGYNHYVKIYITDHSKSLDADTLISKFALAV